jgi:DNA-binding beta-propeller fold protein YncE
VDLVGAVYIADAGSDYVHKFQADGTPLLSFQEPRLASPDEIAVDSGGAIYVTDAARGSVFIFYPDGTRYRERHVVPRRKQKQKQKLGVCVDDAGYVYVLDAATSRVHRFTARGRLVKTWGRKGSGPGQLDSPSNIAVGPDSSLYVTDAGNNRIVKFSREGEFLAAFDAPREPASSGHLAAVAASDRYVFAADSEAHRVYVWTLDGQLKRNEFLSPQPGSQPVVPGDLAAGPRGELFVLDLAGPGVMRFRINF